MKQTCMNLSALSRQCLKDDVLLRLKSYFIKNWKISHIAPYVWRITVVNRKAVEMPHEFARSVIRVRGHHHHQGASLARGLVIVMLRSLKKMKQL